MNNRGILGTFKATVLKFDTPTKTGRIYDSSIYNQIQNDPIVNEQLDNHCLYVTMDGIDTSHIAGAVTELIYNDTENSLEANVDVIATPQGRVLDELLSKDQMVSLSVCGHNLDEEAVVADSHIVTNYELDCIQAYPYQDIWNKKIKNYKKE